MFLFASPDLVLTEYPSFLTTIQISPILLYCAFISAVRGLGKDKITGVVKKIIRLFNDNRITPDEAREVVARIGEIIRVSETE